MPMDMYCPTDARASMATPITSAVVGVCLPPADEQLLDPVEGVQQVTIFMINFSKMCSSVLI